MKKLKVVCLLLSLGYLSAQAQNLNTDKAATSINFKIKNIGLTVQGSFSEFSVMAYFDEQNLSDSYFEGTAVVTSINTGIKLRDEHLQKEEYFHSAQFPAIKLTSTQLRKMGEGQYEFIGQLWIKGKTKDLTFPITVERTDNNLLAKGNFELNRLDFEVGKSSWVLKKKVRVALVYKGTFN